METQRIPEAWRDRETLLELSGRHYIDLFYHHGQHPVEVAGSALLEAQAFIDAGGDPDKIDFDVIFSAALWHDAGFFIPTQWHGLATKEEYSMWLYTVDMMSLGMPEEKIALGASLIAVTAKGTECNTVMERIIRRADLKNVSAANPLDVVRSTLALKDEVGVLAVLADLMRDPELIATLTPNEILHMIYDNPKQYDYKKFSPDIIEFGKGSYNLLNDLLSEDLSVLGCPDFNTPCYRNLTVLSIRKKLKDAIRAIKGPNEAA